MNNENFGKFIIISELGKSEADKYVKVHISDIIEFLQTLLKSEYKQRDIYENYMYLLLGVDNIQIANHFNGHVLDEMNHIAILQRYIVMLGGKPSHERYDIPFIDDINKFFEINLKNEELSTNMYSVAISAISNIDKTLHASLISELSSILDQEREHVEDIKKILKV